MPRRRKPNKPLKPDAAKSKALRDDGIERVARRVWLAAYRKGVQKHIPVDWEGTAEAIRIILINGNHIHPPHHHNAWGGAAKGLIGTGILEPLDRYEAMILPDAHARRTRVYRRRGKIHE